MFENANSISGHIDPRIVVFSGIDTDSGELVEIAQWNIQVKNNESHQIIKNVTSIEQELNYLTKLKHTNLAHYFGFKHDLKGDKMVVYVLKEFICGKFWILVFIYFFNYLFL